MGKSCLRCGQIKPISDYYKHPRMADGHLGKCKECCKIEAINHRNKNIEKARAYDRERGKLPHRKKAVAEYLKTEAGKRSHEHSKTKWMRKHPNRRAASCILNNAIRDGRVIRFPCFICGAKAHAHHPDYDHPLDVVWLCPKHHKDAHALAKDQP